MTGRFACGCLNVKTYTLINIILAGLISSIFIYSGLFSSGKLNHPVPSLYENISGSPAPSAGMSRAFSELVRGNIESAREYNEDSPLVFSFFLIQLLQRISVIILYTRARISRKALLFSDIIMSIALFLYCFKGQILKMAQLMSG